MNFQSVRNYAVTCNQKTAVGFDFGPYLARVFFHYLLKKYTYPHRRIEAQICFLVKLGNSEQLVNLLRLDHLK
jgi:hypothetical protein